VPAICKVEVAITKVTGGPLTWEMPPFFVIVPHASRSIEF
jgi:hypothetical protein